MPGTTAERKIREQYFWGSDGKDDTLRLLAVGRILEENGWMPSTRGQRTFMTRPYQKAEMKWGGRGLFCFTAMRRWAAGKFGRHDAGAGVQDRQGIRRWRFNPETGAHRICGSRRDELDLIIVLRKTQMPAVLVEAGLSTIRRITVWRAVWRNAAAVASGILNVIDDDMDRRPVEERLIITRSRPRGVPHPIAGRAAVRRTAPYDSRISGVWWDVFQASGRCV